MQISIIAACQTCKPTSPAKASRYQPRAAAKTFCRSYFTRKGKSLSTTSGSENFLPGDIVTWDLQLGGTEHIGIVVNVWYKPTQRYLIVHNIGAGTRLEDVLFAWKITGHYRYF